MASNTPDPDAFFALYRYTPSFLAAVITAAAFSIVTALHAWRMFQFKAFYFTPFLIGGVFEIIGYCGRIWSHYELNSVLGFSIQSLFILLGPALFAASIYMVLGRLIRAVQAERHSVIPLRFLTKIFVAGDVVSFFLQGGGGGIQAAGSLELFHLGEKVIVAGLFIQIVVFGFFMATTVVFHLRLRADPTPGALGNGIPWKRYLATLYAVSVIIMVRSVFRVVEYVQGNNGYLIRREYFLYVFDAALMFLVMVILCIQYMGNLEPRSHRKLENDEESLALESMSR